MGVRFRYASSLFAAAVVSSLIGTTACAPRAYRVYDPYYRDYHPWNGHETVYYQRWEGETRRGHIEFGQRHADEQREYWTWRHGHTE
jgi:hypothetical protein